jgi:hypothetical protein
VQIFAFSPQTPALLYVGPAVRGGWRLGGLAASKGGLCHKAEAVPVRICEHGHALAEKSLEALPRAFRLEVLLQSTAAGLRLAGHRPDEEGLLIAESRVHANAVDPHRPLEVG